MVQHKRPTGRPDALDGRVTNAAQSAGRGSRTRSGTISRPEPAISARASTAGAAQQQYRKRSGTVTTFDPQSARAAAVENATTRRAVPNESGTMPILQDTSPTVPSRRPPTKLDAARRVESSPLRSHANPPAPEPVTTTSAHASAAAPPAPSANPTAASLPAFNEAVVLAWAGGLLLAAFMVQTVLRIEWPALSVWQRLDSYKIATGALLVAFLLSQWTLAFARIGGMSRLAKSGYVWHQRSGVFAPVLLFSHSTGLGVGYLTVLTGVFLGNTLCGLVSPRAATRLRRYTTGWIVTHIALSVTVVVLTAYHAWVVFYYE